ncbi:polysaccharide lyase family 8 super-sandwich domain-containing protein [Lacibacter sp. H375]|uniref:polysaccharide lyase family 8 super-sandwich domain-containing protein n=1 Tax=Lacibacter sp. H375 TaxID=3133424 RepID=UPI0030BAED48
MKKLLLALIICCFLHGARAQTFNSSTIPTLWTTSGSNTLSLSSTHYKGGTQSLKWAAIHDQVLTVDINYTASQTGSSNAITHFYLYSSGATTDTLYLRFFDADGSVKRTGRILLNFNGWRDYHRSLVEDYGGNNNLPGFNLDKIEFTFKRSGSFESAKNIWIDEVKWIGDSGRRFPGPHMQLDLDQFDVTSSMAGGWPLESWLNSPDIPETSPTTAEINGISAVASRVSTATSPSGLPSLQQAISYYNTSNISESNGVIIGRGLLYLHDQDTLTKLAAYCSRFAREGDSSRLVLFTKYLIDQGLAEGGRNVMETNSYTNARNFSNYFFDALATGYYTGSVRTDVIKMLKWSNEYNKIYTSGFIIRNNTDYLYVKWNHVLRLALLGNSAQATRDLKSISRYMELFMEPYDGGRDGLKPDGVSFHHRSQYAHYMYAYEAWIAAADQFKETPFRISRKAYDLITFAVKSLYLEGNKGVVRSNASSGRLPFTSNIAVDGTFFKRLITVGGDVLGRSQDDSLAAHYNYFFKNQTYTGVPVINLDGFHQFNYGQMGVKRHQKWIAVQKGLTDKMFGSEIYSSDNRYGRYQSYGALEVLYENLDTTGYRPNGAGWDWNVVPGATTVHLPYTSLRPYAGGTRTEYQAASFAGALAAGAHGIFAIDFVQDPNSNYDGNNLTFRKSVFTFDTIMVCLGSKISGNGGTSGLVATNLFQSIDTLKHPGIYINSATLTTTSTLNTTLSLSQANWIVNAQTTGFYVPQGAGEIKVFRGSQTTPLESSNSGSATATANASKAWISHGASPVDSGYLFAVVPGTTPVKMSALADSIEQGKVYEVLAKTNNLHVVKYIPEKITGYSFFEADTAVNIGFIKSVSNHCLITARESGDTLILRIANPDLNTVPNAEPTIDWLSTPSNVSVTLSRRWRVLGSVSSGTGNSVNSLNNFDDIKLDFVLNQGNYTEVKLIRDESEMGYGVWDAGEDIWFYDLSTVTENGSTIFSSATPVASVSSSTAYGFLPYPPSPSLSRVSLGSQGNGSFERIGSGFNKKIRIVANSASLNKLSAYNIGGSSVTSMFFTLTFAQTGTNGNWILGIGNNPITSLFTNSTNLSSNTYTDGIFGALRFDLGSSNISFKYRKKDASNTVSFVEVNQTTFVRTNENFVEFYVNNSSSSKSYTRRGQPYTVSAGCYHLWVNNSRVSLPVVNYNIPSTELAIGNPVNAFFITSTGNTLPSNNSATLTVADMQARYQNEGQSSSNLPIVNVSGTGNSSDRWPGVIPNIDGDLQVYPNPASGLVNVQYYSTVSKRIPIKLVNTTGVICSENIVEVKAGVNVLLLNLKTVTPGIYIVQAGEKNVRLVVQ